MSLFFQILLLLLFYIDLIYYRTYGFEISIGRFEREISILREIPCVNLPSMDLKQENPFNFLYDVNRQKKGNPNVIRKEIH